jgi:hypothetical protein
MRRLVEIAVMLAASVLASFQIPSVVTFVSVRTGIVTSARWWGLLIWTCFLVVFVCRHLRGSLRYGEFWLRLLGFLVVHLAAFVMVLRNYPEWRLFWFMPIAIVEALLTANVLEDVFVRRFR